MKTSFSFDKFNVAQEFEPLINLCLEYTSTYFFSPSMPPPPHLHPPTTPFIFRTELVLYGHIHN